MLYLRSRITAIAAIGTAVIALPFAAPATAADTNLEAESMVVSPASNGSKLADSTASGGVALGLWVNSSASMKLSLASVQQCSDPC